MSGIVYCVGVGPGDPELMTLKAARLIRECDVIAVPGENAREALSYKIAAGAVPEIAYKPLLAIPAPMTHDRGRVEQARREGAALIEEKLEKGLSVAYLTLGDSSIYCTFSALGRLIEADGYAVETVSGVPSFCAAAARLRRPLGEWDEPIHILPSTHRPDDPLDQPGTYVLMKSGRRIARVRERLIASGRETAMVENCGLPGERVAWGAEAIPDDAGYFTLIIAREHRA